MSAEDDARQHSSIHRAYIKQEANAQLPSDIELNSIAVEIAFHPSKDVLAVGTLDGPVKIYSYTADPSRSNHKLMIFRHYKESCRAVKFSRCDNYLFTGSSDTTIHAIDLDAGAIVRRLVPKTGGAVYCLLSIDNYFLASGDDDGRLVVWDFRCETPVVTFHNSKEYISCMAVSLDKRTLVATSGEGTLTAFNLRSHKVEMQSERFDNEFLTTAILKKESKVVVGTSDGALNIFNWGEWKNTNDTFSCGQNGAVDVVIPISDNILCAGCEDGHIRAVEINPNKVIGIVGTHGDLPVQGLTRSHDHKFLASCSYDQKIKFHDLTVINDPSIEHKPCEKKTNSVNTKLSTSKCNYFSGLL